jgi:hypothetical protein
MSLYRCFKKYQCTNTNRIKGDAEKNQTKKTKRKHEKETKRNKLPSATPIFCCHYHACHIWYVFINRELIQIRLIHNIPNFNIAAHSAQNKSLAVSRKGRRCDQRTSLSGANDCSRSYIHNVKTFFSPRGNVAAVWRDTEWPAFAGARAGESIRCKLAVLGHPDVHGCAPDGDNGVAIR